MIVPVLRPYCDPRECQAMMATRGLAHAKHDRNDSDRQGDFLCWVAVSSLSSAVLALVTQGFSNGGILLSPCLICLIN